MGKDTGISWCRHTFNPWWGCARVSRACVRCYAEAWAKRTGHEVWGKNATRRMLSDDHWRGPIRWDRQAEFLGERHRVFCGSMCDVFEDRDDLVEPRRRLFDLITETPNLDWLLLTKRPENILDMVPAHWHSNLVDGAAWPENVWTGTTVENQECADGRIPHLLNVPAPVRFLSMEPLVEQVDISAFLATSGDGVEDRPWGSTAAWVICGGESGGGAVRMDPDWARSVRDQCAAAGAAFHFKQTGAVLAKEWGLEAKAGDDPAEWPAEFQIREFPRQRVA